MDHKEFGTIAGNVECEVIEDMEVLQYKMHKSIDCDVVAIIKYTIIVFVSGIVIPLFLLWAKDFLSKIGCWNNLILFLVMAVFLYSIVMAAKHTYNYFQKQETSKGETYKFKQMVNKSKHEQKFDDIKKHTIIRFGSVFDINISFQFRRGIRTAQTTDFFCQSFTFFF